MTFSDFNETASNDFDPAGDRGFATRPENLGSFRFPVFEVGHRGEGRRRKSGQGLLFRRSRNRFFRVLVGRVTSELGRESGTKFRALRIRRF